MLLLIGVIITLVGNAVIGYAGSLRSKQMSEEEKKKAVKEFALTKGLAVALLAGFMSACFALGLDAGSPIKESALAHGVKGLYAGLPVIFLVTVGGFVTNAVYCIYQNIKNDTAKNIERYLEVFGLITFCLCFSRSFMVFSVLWFRNGQKFLIDSPILMAFSWSILMALNVTFSNVWGVILKEWKGVKPSAILVLVVGLLILISSIIVVALAQNV